MHNQLDAETSHRNIGEVRSLVERRRDLIADLVAAGLNTADIEATFKALTAQLELFEQQLSNQDRFSSRPSRSDPTPSLTGRFKRLR